MSFLRSRQFCKKVMLGGKYFIDSGDYVVSPCLPSQHVTVDHSYSLVVLIGFGIYAYVKFIINFVCTH